MDWFLPTPIEIPDGLQAAAGGHPLVAEILARRGFTTPEAIHSFLDPHCYKPAPPTEIPDMAEAGDRLFKAIKAKKRILVWGDFDVDGQTATSLLVDGLKTLGADVVYHVPHRMLHGHGVQPEVLATFYGKVDLMLTCDTGIAEHEAIEAGQAAGLEILITDHHALPPRLPEAPAVVNPQRLPPGHPLRDLPGVGVAYKLIQHLYALAGRTGEEEHFLDLVALGIVADVATQRHDTRYLLQLGLDRLRHPQRLGLKALIRAAQVDVSNLAADTIGFQIGPRLNALGRLDDAMIAVDLLTTADEGHANQIAARLEILNARRKQIENQIYAAAQEQIARDSSLLDDDAIVLAGPNWHPGVIGIVASRIVEQYGKPAILISVTDSVPAGGSARSVPGVDIGAAIAANADLLIKHGGHPGAAGLTIDPDLIPQLRRRLARTVRDTRDPDIRPGYHIDAVIPLSAVSEELVADLDRLSPFGAGNQAVHIMTPGLRRVESKAFGINKVHRKVTVEDERGIRFIVTWWRGSEYPEPRTDFDLLYVLRFNDYRGRRTVELEWVDSRPLPGLEVDSGPRYTVIDWRHEPLRPDSLPPDELTVWAEGIAAHEIPFHSDRISTRYAPQEARTLLIWTSPPGPEALEEMLGVTGARTVHVVGHDVPEEVSTGFAKRLAGLLKYAIRAYDGETSVRQLAAATAQREITTRRALEFLAAKGYFSINWEWEGPEPDSIKIDASSDQVSEAKADELEDDVRALLAESAAYRAYFRRANLDAFFNQQQR